MYVYNIFMHDYNMNNLHLKKFLMVGIIATYPVNNNPVHMYKYDFFY